jgi:hypothetical protein
MSVVAAQFLCEPPVRRLGELLCAIQTDTLSQVAHSAHCIGNERAPLSESCTHSFRERRSHSLKPICLNPPDVAEDHKSPSVGPWTRIAQLLYQFSYICFDQIPALGQKRLQTVCIIQRRFLQHKAVHVPFDGREILKIQPGRGNCTRNNFIGMIEEIAVVRCAPGEASDDTGPCLSSSAASPLCIVGWAGRYVPHRHALQIAYVHAEFERRCAYEDVWAWRGLFETLFDF